MNFELILLMKTYRKNTIVC